MKNSWFFPKHQSFSYKLLFFVFLLFESQNANSISLPLPSAGSTLLGLGLGITTGLGVLFGIKTAKELKKSKRSSTGGKRKKNTLSQAMKNASKSLKTDLDKIAYVSAISATVFTLLIEFHKSQKSKHVNFPPPPIGSDGANPSFALVSKKQNNSRFFCTMKEFEGHITENDRVDLIHYLFSKKTSRKWEFGLSKLKKPTPMPTPEKIKFFNTHKTDRDETLWDLVGISEEGKTLLAEIENSGQLTAQHMADPRMQSIMSRFRMENCASLYKKFQDLPPFKKEDKKIIICHGTPPQDLFRLVPGLCKNAAQQFPSKSSTREGSDAYLPLLCDYQGGSLGELLKTCFSPGEIFRDYILRDLIEAKIERHGWKYDSEEAQKLRLELDPGRAQKLIGTDNPTAAFNALRVGLAMPCAMTFWPSDGTLASQDNRKEKRTAPLIPIPSDIPRPRAYNLISFARNMGSSRAKAQQKREAGAAESETTILRDQMACGVMLCDQVGGEPGNEPLETLILISLGIGSFNNSIPAFLGAQQAAFDALAKAKKLKNIIVVYYTPPDKVEPLQPWQTPLWKQTEEKAQNTGIKTTILDLSGDRSSDEFKTNLAKLNELLGS